MGKSRQQLIQEYEDAKLALLLDEYAEIYGKVSAELYEKDVASGIIIPIADEEQQAQLNDILQRAEAEEAKKVHFCSHFKVTARKVATIAAAITIFSLLMITVQAAGIDVFGAVGRWTDSLFHFETDSGNDIDTNSDIEPQSLSSIAEIRKNMAIKGFPLDMAPSWIPDDFSITKISFPENDGVQSAAFLLVNSKGDWLSYQIDKASNNGTFGAEWIEKDDDNVETITSDSRLFYIFQNNSVWTGISQGKEYRISIIVSGKNDLIQIIDSIGEMYYD